MLDGTKATTSTPAMVLSMILVGAGGALSVVGSRVAAQASVPHDDVALAISLLSLWSKIGSAIGSAVVAVIWASEMPRQLRRHLPATATEADVQKLFGSPRSIRTLYAMGEPMREGAILAYRRALYYCLAVALGLAFVPLVASLFQRNYYLGKTQNAVSDEGNDGVAVGAVVDEEKKADGGDGSTLSKKERFLRFWAGRA